MIDVFVARTVRSTIKSDEVNGSAKSKRWVEKYWKGYFFRVCVDKGGDGLANKATED